MSFSFSQKLDRYIEQEQANNDDWWDSVFEKVDEATFERVEAIQYDPFFFKWMDKLQYADIGATVSAEIITRAIKIYKL